MMAMFGKLALGVNKSPLQERTPVADEIKWTLDKRIHIQIIKV